MYTRPIVSFHVIYCVSSVRWDNKRKVTNYILEVWFTRWIQTFKYPPFSFSPRPHVLSELFQFSSRSGHVVLLQWWVYAPYVFYLHLPFS